MASYGIFMIGKEVKEGSKIIMLVVMTIGLDLFGYCYFIIGFSYGYLLLEKGYR